MCWRDASAKGIRRLVPDLNCPFRTGSSGAPFPASKHRTILIRFLPDIRFAEFPEGMTNSPAVEENLSIAPRVAGHYNFHAMNLAAEHRN